MLFIGICGASGSGKSTLAEELATMVNKSILIINQDAYYKDHPDLSFEERCLLNYDEPSIFDHDLLLSDVHSLLEGQRVSKKRYDYSHHCRADVSVNISSRTMSSSWKASMLSMTPACAL